jgi:hypothetical protein
MPNVKKTLNIKNKKKEMVMSYCQERMKNIFRTCCERKFFNC